MRRDVGNEKKRNQTMDKIKKGYKRTEIGALPDDWEVKKLGEFITIKGGIAFTSHYFSDKGPILITPGNFKLNGGLYFNQKNTKRYLGPYSSKMTFKSGDLLIVMTDLTPDCNLLGKPAFVETQEIVLHNQRIGKILVHDNVISTKYLYWLMLSPLYLNQIKDKATGSTVRHTSNSSVYSSIIPLPSLPEQKAITEVLSDADNLIQTFEKCIAKKCLIKQGAMQKLLTPKEDWEVKKLGEILKVKHGKSQKDIEDRNGQYPILGTGGLMGYANQFLYNRESVLIGRKGTIDKPRYMDIPFWTVDTLFYTEIFKYVSPKYLFYKFLQIDWYSYNEASGVPSLNAKTIENIEIPLPPLEQQTHIATILSDIDNEIEALEKKLAKYKQIKQGLMQNLLTGKLRLI